MENKTGETDLEVLIRNMEPILNEGDYVFSIVPDSTSIPRDIIFCEIKESEGTTIVFKKEDAEKFELPFDFVASWITLNIHSSLEAIGLTAAFSSELSIHKISCNVIAGYYHDHIFVDKKDGKRAVNVLLKMTKK